MDGVKRWRERGGRDEKQVNGLGFPRLNAFITFLEGVIGFAPQCRDQREEEEEDPTENTSLLSDRSRHMFQILRMKGVVLRCVVLRLLFLPSLRRLEVSTLTRLPEPQSAAESQ